MTSGIRTPQTVREAHSVTRRRDLIEDIIELVTLIAKDDAATRATLALLRNGHPEAARFDHGHKARGNEDTGWDSDDPQVSADSAISYPDPTGDLGIRPDDGVRRLKQYRLHLTKAHYHIEQADVIRRFAKPDTHEAKKQTDPDDWCKNCLPYGHCAPRNGDRHHYCRWCQTIRQTWGFLPPERAVKLHHEGENGKALAVLQAHKGARR